MSGSIIIRSQGGPDSRERTRDRYLSRLMLAAQHSEIRRSVALPHDLRFVVSSGVGCRRGVLFDRRNLEIVKARQPFKFVPIFRGVGSLIPIGFHSALTVCQDTARGFADQFHFSLSAQVTGLVAAEYGQHSSERKQVCPTEDGSNPTRNRVNVP